MLNYPFMRNSLTVLLLISVAVITGCSGSSKRSHQERQENLNAKKMLQGIWVNDDEQDVAFMAKGDTIYYPDTTSQPAYFRIIDDTLELGGTGVRYAIVKQAPHLFIFRNQAGDQVRLVRSSDPDDASYFIHRRPVALNQGKLIKRDTVTVYNDERYHSYIQVNPTTYKVIKTAYNDDGVAVDNVYYDNIIHLGVYHGASSLYSHDFYKSDFQGYVPANVLSQSVLSDMVLTSADADGIHFEASILIPDSPTGYQLTVSVGYDGKLSIKAK